MIPAPKPTGYPGGAPPRRIAYFVTGHGFGHGVRATALIRALPPGVETLIFTALPADFFREELPPAARFRHFPLALDCGCLQPDTVSVDIPGTLSAYAAIDARREDLIAEGAARLRAEGADLVLGDLPPLAFPMARAAGIPSLAVGNFTWDDIYTPYLEGYPAYRPVVERLRADYAAAGAYARLHPGLPARLFGRVEEVGILARPGRPRRGELARRFGLDPGKRWCLVYVGNYGLGGVDWPRLAAFRDWEFFGLYDLPGAPANYHRLAKAPDFSYADLTASGDLVLGKLGYGLVSECLVHGKPVLFLERRDFAEYAPLKELLEGRGQGVELGLEGLRRLDLEGAMEALTGKDYPREPSTGVERLLEILGFSG